MTWKLHNPLEAKRLEEYFSNLGVNFQQPCFCDHPNFLAAERTDPRILEKYALYIESKECSPAYLNDARKKIELASEAVRAAVEADGRKGACIDAAGILGRMLDRLGVWNYVANSCLKISFPSASSLPAAYFYAVDTDQVAAPHAIVVAPPFYVVDVTAKHQSFDTTRHASHISEKILLDKFEPASWSKSDILSPDVEDSLILRGIPPAEYLNHYHNGMLEVAGKLPARQYTPASLLEASLKYTIVSVGGFIEQLEDIEGYKPCNRTAQEIFDEDVLPHL